MAWLRAKLVTLISDRVPVRSPRCQLLRTSHESSMTLSSCASAIALIWSQSGQLPHRLGVRMAFVLGPIMSTICVASIWYVLGSMSTKTGTIPDWTMGAISVENVMGEVMISSPGCRRRRSIASRRDDDPELTITPWFLESS